MVIDRTRAGPDWDTISGREISHSSRPHRKKRGPKLYLWYKQKNRAAGQISRQATGNSPGAPDGQSGPGHGLSTHDNYLQSNGYKCLPLSH